MDDGQRQFEKKTRAEYSQRRSRGECLVSKLLVKKILLLIIFHNYFIIACSCLPSHFLYPKQMLPRPGEGFLDLVSMPERWQSFVSVHQISMYPYRRPLYHISESNKLNT